MKNFNLIIYFVISKFYGLFIIAHCKDSFNENLKVKPLSHNLVQVEFEFILRRFFNRSSVDIYQYRNFDIFPRSFAQLVEPSNVSEFKVSLTQGNWRWKQWGAPISEAAPFGGRLTAWFDVDDSNLHDISLLREEETQLQSQWKLLSSSLSGYLCGSFSFIEDQHNTFSPSFSFEPTGKAHFSSEGSYKREQLLLRTHKSKRYSMWLDSLFSSSVSKKNPCEKKRANQKLFLSHYPIERVCTENLLPLLRLLPCRSAQGLSSLIDPSKLFSAKYTSLSLFWKRYCPYEKSLCDVRSGELVVTVSYVTEREPLSLGNSLLHFLFKNSFSQLDSCALAEQSYVSFDPDGSGIFAITKTIQEVKDGLLMDENNTFLQKEKEKEKERKYWLWDSKFPVEMERRLTGSGKQKRGHMVFIY
jgi:phosphatidylinositol glycan class T